MFASGGLLLVLIMATNTINVPEEPTDRITLYNSSVITEHKEPFDFSLEGENYQLKVFWIMISIFLIIGGVLIEVKK